MDKVKFKGKYRIESARCKNYDYASNGAYFITIVTKDRQHFFGNIINDSMVLNDIGKIAQKYWNEIPNHFPFIRLDEMVVMPNHVHGVLWIDNLDGDVRRRDAINRVSTTNHISTINRVSTTGGITGKNNPMFHNNISRVIRWYKGRCTFEINKIYGKLFFAWQSRFHDRIIRDTNELHRIQNYIIENPKNWYRDRNK